MPDALETFIIEAKAAAYVGGGAARTPSRMGAHDIAYARDRFSYLDSYFGGTDFAGQETVWLDETPVWAMNYYGRILRDDLLDGAAGGRVIKAALSALYREGRFLGGFAFEFPPFTYTDTNQGSYASFIGVETIRAGDAIAYRLDYHGGTIRE